MKKFYTIFSIILLFAVTLTPTNSYSQCEPDSSYASPGYYPDPLPDGCVSIDYNEVVTVVFPPDTNLGGLGVLPFSQFVLDEVINLPDGITYECNMPDCIYPTNPPNNTYGCVVLSGVPTTPFSDSVEVKGLAYVQGIPLPLSISIFIGANIYESGASCPLSVSEESLKNLGLSVYPNPVDQSANITFNLDRGQLVNVEVFNITGTKVANVFSGRANSGMNSFSLEGSDLSPSIYVARITLEDGTSAQAVKFIVR